MASRAFTALVLRPELRDPAGLLPKLDVVPLCKSLRLFPGDLVGADQLNAFNNVAIRPDKVCSIFRHGGRPCYRFIVVKLSRTIFPWSVRFQTRDRYI